MEFIDSNFGGVKRTILNERDFFQSPDFSIKSII